MARTDAWIGAAAISGMLASRIDALAPQLLPAGKLYQRRWWRAGSLGGEPGQSLAIEMTGPRRGHWRDYNGDLHGDALDLVARIACRGELGEAIQWARRWLGLGDIDPEERRRLAAEAERRRHLAERAAERAAEHKRQDARTIWLRGAKPLARGDAVWRYLAGRGIELGTLARLPGALRCHPSLWNAESGREWPAMTAAIADNDGRILAVHRTWLAPRNLACEDGSAIGKAPLAEPKMTLGDYRGRGAIHLWRGASMKPWPHMLPGETLILAEGIEDAMAAVTILPQFRAAAAVSHSAMASLELPKAVGRILLLAQNDLPGSPAARSVARSWRRWRDEGREVVPFPVPANLKDAAELAAHPHRDFLVARLLAQISGGKAA